MASKAGCSLLPWVKRQLSVLSQITSPKFSPHLWGDRQTLLVGLQQRRKTTLTV